MYVYYFMVNFPGRPFSFVKKYIYDKIVFYVRPTFWLSPSIVSSDTHKHTSKNKHIHHKIRNLKNIQILCSFALTLLLSSVLLLLLLLNKIECWKNIVEWKIYNKPNSFCGGMRLWGGSSGWTVQLCITTNINIKSSFFIIIQKKWKKQNPSNPNIIVDENVSTFLVGLHHHGGPD